MDRQDAQGSSQFISSMTEQAIAAVHEASTTARNDSSDDDEGPQPPNLARSSRQRGLRKKPSFSAASQRWVPYKQVRSIFAPSSRSHDELFVNQSH